MVPERAHQSDLRERGLQEKCGMFALLTTAALPTDLQRQMYEALPTLEHRGNNGAGHVWVDPNTNQWHDIRTEELVADLSHLLLVNEFEPTKLNLFHTRYTTSGGAENTQPFIEEHGPYRLALQHNGNIPAQYLSELRSRLTIDRMPPDASDSRIITAYLVQEREKYTSWEETFIHCLPDIKGAYSLIMMTEDETIYAARDVFGVRPLVYGFRDISAEEGVQQMCVIASESPTLEAMGIDPTQQVEVPPGSFVAFKHLAEKTTRYSSITVEQNEKQIEQHTIDTHAETASAGLCALESIYFMRDDTVINGKTVREHRIELGKGGARQLKAKGLAERIDMVVPVLNSGKWAAVGVADELNKMWEEFITRNKKVRSFIQATDTLRKEVVFNKHSVSLEAQKKMAGKKIAIVDDSLIRGNSFKDVIAKVRGDSLLFKGDSETDAVNSKEGIAKPAEIHVVVASPPVIEICDLGIAIADREELLVRQLIALKHPEIVEGLNNFRKLSEFDQHKIQTIIEETLAEYLGIDSMTFIPYQVLQASLGPSKICTACFGGHHPFHHEQERKSKVIHRRDFVDESTFLAATVAQQITSMNESAMLPNN